MLEVNHMVPGAEKSHQDHVQRLGGVFRKGDPQGIVDVEKRSQPLTGVGYNAACLDGQPVARSSR
jgi:hypothetical protein